LIALPVIALVVRTLELTIFTVFIDIQCFHSDLNVKKLGNWRKTRKYFKIANYQNVCLSFVRLGEAARTGESMFSDQKYFD
jgi:hypothetical protein